MSRRAVLATAALALLTHALGAQSNPQDAYQRALEELAEGRVTEAIQILEEAPEEDASLQARALLGVLYIETERPDEALRLLQPLSETADPDPGVLYNAGRAAMRIGKLELAERYLSQSLERAPGSPAARELGLLKGAQGDYREAFALLVPWARQQPQDMEARLAAAASALILERVPTAEELLSDLPQDRPQVRLLWGRLLLSKGDPYGAAATLKPLVEAADTDPRLAQDTRRYLAEAYTMAGSSASAVEVLQGHTEGDPAMALQLSLAHYLSGDLEGALSAISAFAEPLQGRAIRADDPAAGLAQRILVHYGKLLSSNEQHEAAVPYLRQATDLAPDDGQAWQALGQALAVLGETEEANLALQRFREIAQRTERVSVEEIEEGLRDPTGLEVQEGMRALISGDATQALQIARSESKLAPDDPRPALLEVRALLELGRPEEALDASERLLLRFPDLADAHYVRGIVRMAFRDLDQAEEDLRTALDLSPQHVAAMNDLAVLLMDRGEEAEARQLLERALQVFPDDPVARSNLEKLEED